MLETEKYKLTKKESVKERTFRVIISADSNDGDYISTDYTYTETEFNKGIVDLLIDLDKNYSGRHDLEEFPNSTEEKCDFDYNCDKCKRDSTCTVGIELDIPHSDWGICHTIQFIDITCEDLDGTLYEVKLK